MERRFIKMQGCGNDYIYFDCLEEGLKNPEEVSLKLSDRHFGIGGDGIVLILKSHVADAKMRMFNADGSEGKMCGNAIRCVGKYLFDNKLVSKTIMTIETLSGIKTLFIKVKDEKAYELTVNMGSPVLKTREIPALLPENEKVIDYPLQILGDSYRVTLVSMGNPHCVVFVDDTNKIEIGKIGPLFEKLDIFPERINTEFVEIVSSEEIKMRVWERGSGETLACGTGACASVVAGILNGVLDKNKETIVKLLGGELKIKVNGEGVFMTGSAETVFEGKILI